MAAGSRFACSHAAAKRDIGRYVFKMAGVYPARGCPFTCNSCSVIQIAGRRVRSQNLDTTHTRLRTIPENYSVIVRLCRKHGIGTHFSNITGFPIREHVQVLKSLDPDVSSFYILTPCPGTEQYDDFLASGLIFEQNLDRFDATTVTWTHDRMSGKEIEDLLFESHRDFHTKAKIARCGMAAIRRGDTGASWALKFALPAFSRYSAFKRRHPMSGGIVRVIRDHESEYRDLRRERYGLDRVPLPRSLRLSEADEALNRKVNIAV